MNMRPNRPRIRIVRLGEPREYLRTELVQRDAWGIEQADIIIPFHMMIAAQHHGGLVLGAYDGKKKHPSLSQLKAGKAGLINETDLEDGVRRPVKSNLNLNEDRLLFEIPSSIEKVKVRGLDLARKWTLHNRRAFENYFGKKYIVTDVLLDREDDENRTYYSLERGFRPLA